MATENIFIINPENTEQENALKVFVKALKIKFEIANEKPYNQDFVAKIKKVGKNLKKAILTTSKKKI